jgi:hypothetical protein
LGAGSWSCLRRLPPAPSQPWHVVSQSRRCWPSHFLNVSWRYCACAGPQHFVVDLLYEGVAALAREPTRRAWRSHITHLVEQVLDVVRRDFGCQVLVVVNVRYCYHMRRALRLHPEVALVRYSEL